jgi:predicted CoA-binding protein
MPGHADVLIDCLGRARAVKVVEEAADAGIGHIFFQPGTDSPEALRLCETKGIKAHKGCLLRHWPVSGITRFISPCFYMGLGAPKLSAQ